MYHAPCRAPRNLTPLGLAPVKVTTEENRQNSLMDLRPSDRPEMWVSGPQTDGG
jgi:hypothetical protein